MDSIGLMHMCTWSQIKHCARKKITSGKLYLHKFEYNIQHFNMYIVQFNSFCAMHFIYTTISVKKTIDQIKIKWIEDRYSTAHKKWNNTNF